MTSHSSLTILQYPVKQGINSIYHDLGYVHTIADSLSFRQEKPAMSQNWTKYFTHIEHCAGAVGREKSQSSLLNIGLPWQWFQSFFPTHSLLRRSEYLFTLHKVWYRTYPICHAPLSRSSWRCFCMLQKSRLSHQKPLLSDIIFVPAQKVSGIVWT